MTFKECESCLEDILAGSSDGLKRLYGAYYNAVFALSLSILKDYHKAEDAAQEVFLKIWTNASSYRFGGNPKVWIMAITRNLCIDFLRKQKHETPDAAVCEVAASSVDLDALVENRAALTAALSALPETEREIFILHFVWDSSYLTISRLLKMPLATVAWKCTHSLRTMQKFLLNAGGKR
jgi:RNA polymerase sigma factor, sigma-70 family